MSRYCICRSTESKTFMIGCDHCEEWFHGKCIGITKKQSASIEFYYCDQCKKADPKLEIKYKSGYVPLQKKQEQPVAPKIVLPNVPKKRKVGQKTKAKNHPRKPCANSDCIYESRQESNYCSDQCGYNMNKLRYDTYFVPKWRELEKNHSAARQRKLADLDELVTDQKNVEDQIRNLRREKEQLEHNISVIKQEAKKLYRENTNSKENNDDDADDDDEVEETATGDSKETFCFTCGRAVLNNQTFRHWFICHKRAESTYNFTGDMQVRHGIEGDEDPKLYCHYLDKKTQRYCMHVESNCPQHSNWLVDKDEVCGCPLSPNVMQKLEPDGNYCLQLKKDCTLHYHWDRFMLTQINLQRINAFTKLEAIKDKIRSGQANLMDSYGGVVGVMLHNTIDHIKKQNDCTIKDEKDDVEDIDMNPVDVE